MGKKWTVQYASQLVRNKKPTGCPRCSNNEKMNTEIFKELVFKLVGDEYKVIGEYTKSSKPIDILHTKCGTKYPVRPNDFQQGYRCPSCAHGHSKKTQNEFELEIANLTNGEYIVTGKYEGCGKHVNLTHLECGTEFPVKPTNFLSNGTRCPECASKKSKGCKHIENVLNNKNIIYTKENIIDGLKCERSLRVDYYIPSLNLYIEFDGKQHFYPQLKFGGDLYLNKCRNYDIIKNNFFINKKLNLLRIDDTNYGKFSYILTNLMNKRSTTNEKYNLFYIESGELIFDNGKYTDL